MITIVIAVAMVVFSAVTTALGRRRGSGISPRPYGNVSDDATKARKLPAGVRQGDVNATLSATAVPRRSRR